MQSSLCDGIRHIADGARHVRECSLLGAGITSLSGEFSQKGNLEVIKVLIVPGQFPVSPILELCFNDKPVLVLCKAIARYPGRDGCIEFRCRARYKFVLLGESSRLRGQALSGLLGGILLTPDRRAKPTKVADSKRIRELQWKRTGRIDGGII